MCECPIIPTHLHQKSRVVNNNFSAQEKLFRRIPFQNKEGALNIVSDENSTKISLNYFRLQDMSCNREKCCNPEIDSEEDVLYDIVNCKKNDKDGIIQFCVEDINSASFPHNTDSKRLFTLHIVHDPQPCMYPHVEIRIIENGNKEISIDPNGRMVKAMIKEYYQSKSVIIKQPLP